MDSRHRGDFDANLPEFHIVFISQLVRVEGDQTQTCTTILEAVDELGGKVGEEGGEMVER